MTAFRQPRTALRNALGLTGLLLLLTSTLPYTESLFHALFPLLERPVFRQQSFWSLLLAHVGIVAVSSLTALCVAGLLGVWVTRLAGRAYRSSVEALVAMGQTVPPVAVLALTVPLIGFGSGPAYIALTLYGVLPMLQGVIAGLDSVPAELRDVARGLGFRRSAIFWSVELPLAAPVVLAGIRTSVTINIGTAAIAATVGAQNLGSPIVIGVAGFNTAYVLQGALLTGLLALAVDALFEYFAQRLRRHRPQV